MPQNELFFKKKQITESGVELTFHRDYTGIYNTAQFPVVKYILNGCKNIESLDWESMDIHNDGLLISCSDKGDHSIFQTTDMGGTQFEVVCERIIQEEGPYDIEDLTDLLKGALRKLDNEAIFVNRLQGKINALNHFLEKELESNNRKLDQAGWLTEAKRQFLHGQNTIIQLLLKQIKSE